MEITIGRSLRHWWVFVLRGALFILLSIYLFASPESGFLALGFVFGMAILLAGIAELMHAYNDHEGSGTRRWHLIVGLIDVVLGILLISHLGASMDIVRIMVGIYFLFRGISIFMFRNSTGRSWWVITGGAVVILFALLVLFNPVFGAVTIITVIALAFLITGILNVMLGLRMKPKV